jgi:glyoxylase-like metal-dependent hydrolase (beta-lactamase superfamily II)
MTILTRSLFAGVCAALCGLCTQPIFAAAPMVKTQVPGFYRLMLGEFEVTALFDGANPLASTAKLLHGDPGRVAEELKLNFLGEEAETSHNSFLVNTGTKLVLIDAGAGAMLGPHSGDLLNNLRAAGYRPEQVDEVYLTHMHTDHVGGLVIGDKRAFPNATVRVNKREMDYWLSEANMRAAPDTAKRFFSTATAAVTPYIQAGKLKPFDGDTDLIRGIRAQAAYGHTPGHTMYVVESGGQKLLLWGDIVHVAAVQFNDPSVTITWDVDAPEAEHERELVLADAAKSGYLIGGAHLPFPGLGHVRRTGEQSYAFAPINYISLK